MWQAILLSIRKAYLKHKLKKAKLKEDKKQASLTNKDSRKVKKLKFRILLVNIQLVAVIVGMVLAVILAIALLINTFMFIANVAGWHIIGQEDMTQDPEDTDGKNWTWDVDDPNNPNNSGSINISGGIYPKDPIMKNRAYMIKVLQRSAADASSKCGEYLDPAWLLGTLTRETGTGIFQKIDENRDDSWLRNLTYAVPVCGKGSKCSYVKSGHSHFIGGSIVNGVDTGDPHTMRLNDDKELYKSTGGDHAVGFVQYEIPYALGRMVDTFPLESEFGIPDSTVNALRPNIFYIPDQIYSAAQLLNGSVNSSTGVMKQTCNTIMNSTEFKTLDKDNQNFILYVLKSIRYGAGGSWKSEYAQGYIDGCMDLMNVVHKGKIDKLENMLVPIKTEFYNKNTHMGVRDAVRATNYINSTYGLNVSLKGVTNYGIFSACVGRVIWDQMMADIDAAEKESVSNGQSAGGQWIDYIGSGKFQRIATSGKTYYSDKVQATVFAQTSNQKFISFMEPSWNVTLPNTNNRGSKTTLVAAGCGVYTTAFCISNLTGTLVTPIELIEKGYVKSIPLPDSKVIEIPKKYGLDTYSWKKPKSDAEFESGVIDILKDGGLVVGVWKPSFPWYTGSSAHFMAIRGYDRNTNELYVYTSAGAGGKNFEDVSATVKLPASTVRAHLSASHSSMQVIKIKGGAGSISQTPNGGSPGSNGMVWPLPSGTYHVTSLQGYRIHPITHKWSNHGGADIGAAGGTDIYAAKSGVVDVVNKWDGTTSGVQSYGNYVRIKHNDGTYTLYAHMSKTIATKGQTVNAGDLIGKVGTTGRSTGNHLHFELYEGGSSSSNRVDPLVYYTDLPLYMSKNGVTVYLNDIK